MEKEIIELHAEEIPNEIVPVKGSFAVAIQKLADTQVAKLGEFEARIAELREKYSGINIKDLTDGAGHEESRKALGELRKMRTSTEKDIKELKAPLIKANKEISSKGDWIITKLQEIEKPIQDRKDWYDAETKRIDDEKEAILDKRLAERIAYLKRIGADFDGSRMVMDDVYFEVSMIRSTSDEIYNIKMLPKFEALFAEKEKIRIANEEAIAIVKKQEAEAAEKLKEEQRKLKLEQDKLEQHKKDAAKLALKVLQDRFEAREKELFLLGLSKAYHSGDWAIGYVKIGLHHVEQATPEQWEKVIENYTPLIEKEIIAIQEAGAKEIQRIRDEAVADADRKRKLEEEAKEEERLKLAAEAGDKIKYQDILTYLKETPHYEFKSKHFRAKNRIIRDFLADLK